MPEGEKNWLAGDCKFLLRPFYFAPLLCHPHAIKRRFTVSSLNQEAMSDRQSDLFQLGIRRWALGAERWPTLANADRPKRPRAQTRPANMS